MMNAILFMDKATAARPQAPARSPGKPGEAAEGAAGALFAVLLQQAVKGGAAAPAEGGQAAEAGGKGGAGAEAAGDAQALPAAGQAAAQIVEMPLPAGTAPADGAPAAETGVTGVSPEPKPPSAAGARSQAAAQEAAAAPQPVRVQPAEPQPTSVAQTAPEAVASDTVGAGSEAAGKALPASGNQDPKAPPAMPQVAVPPDGRPAAQPSGRSERPGVPAAQAAGGAHEVGATEGQAGISRRETADVNQPAQPVAPEGRQGDGIHPAGQAPEAQTESGRREMPPSPQTKEKVGSGRQAEQPPIRPDGSAVLVQQAVPQPQNAAATMLQTQPAPVTAQPREILNQVISRVKVTLQGDRTEARIHLVPENLGPVDLKVTMDGGQFTAHFHVASGQVKEILEQHLPELKQVLHDQGFRVEQFSVSMGTGSTYQDPGLGQQAQSQAQSWQTRTAHYGRYRDEVAQPGLVTPRQEANGAARRLDLIA